MDRIVSELAVIAAGIIGLAIIATLVSRNANTAKVIESSGSAFANAIRAATGPVTGGGMPSFNAFSTF